MLLTEMQGLKYPDDYFIKFFFKNGFHMKESMTFLEFGAGNGSNLMLPYQYTHRVIGVDYDTTLIRYAKHNFEKIEGDAGYEFFDEDMRKFVKHASDIKADVLSLPNIVNYISKEDFVTFLKRCKSERLIAENAILFIRFRTPKDFRHGLGKRIETHCYRINENDDTTGEAGALNSFYTEVEMVDILREHLGLQTFQSFGIDFENSAANGDTIFNSDIVIWGELV